MARARVQVGPARGVSAHAAVEWPGSGGGTSDYASRHYRKLSRPIYPREPIAA